jgi:hypothetical protein
MRESDIEKYFVKQVEAIGGVVRKVQWIGRNNAPDRVAMLPETRDFSGATLWAELKAPRKDARGSQQREHNRMRAVGQWVEVIDTKEKVDQVLEPWLRWTSL